MKTQVDCYGFAATSEFFHRRQLEPFLISPAGPTTYVRFS